MKKKKKKKIDNELMKNEYVPEESILSLFSKKYKKNIEDLNYFKKLFRKKVFKFGLCHGYVYTNEVESVRKISLAMTFMLSYVGIIFMIPLYSLYFFIEGKYLYFIYCWFLFFINFKYLKKIELMEVLKEKEFEKILGEYNDFSFLLFSGVYGIISLGLLVLVNLLFLYPPYLSSTDNFQLVFWLILGILPAFIIKFVYYINFRFCLFIFLFYKSFKTEYEANVK